MLGSCSQPSRPCHASPCPPTFITSDTDKLQYVLGALSIVRILHWACREATHCTSNDTLSHVGMRKSAMEIVAVIAGPAVDILVILFVDHGE